MYITKLVLYKYNRFKLLGADKIEYTPQSPYQLFTGKNGIGKSSLLYELSPLPCESTDLEENGFKEIHIEHHKSNYVIRYEMHKKLLSSFIKDGVELNDGGTIKVQRDLVWEHFQYDNNIHDLLSGIDLFTGMSPQTRREWFVRMSRSDMNYAISLYNRIRSAERDVRGALKINQQRLTQEQLKLPSKAEIEQAKSESQSLKTELNHLLPFSQQYLSDKTDELFKLKQSIINVSNHIYDFDFYQLNYKDYRDIDELKVFRDKVTFNRSKLNDEYSQALHELAELQDIYTKNQQLTQKPLHVIDSEISANVELYQRHEQQYLDIGFDVGDNVNRQLLTFKELSDKLAFLFSQLKRNPYIDENQTERLYTREKYAKITKRIGELKEARYAANNRLEYTERELTNIKNIHDVECPECHYSFKPGIRCNDIPKLEEQVNEMKSSLVKLEEELSRLTDQEVEMNEWVSQMRLLRQYQDEYPLHANLFIHFMKSPLLFDNPISLKYDIDKYFNALDIRQAMMHLEEVGKQLQEERIRRVAAEGNDMEYVMKKMKTLEAKVEALKILINQLIDELSSVERTIAAATDLNQLIATLRTHITQYHTLTLDQIKYTNNRKLQELISERQSKLAIADNIVTQLSQTEFAIKQLEEDNEKLKTELKHYQVLIALLSPQDGLIAESMLGFLNQFLDEMYNVIDNIWSYTMRPYLELGEDGVDLDYRFKVEVEGLDNPVKDVSRLSRGQKEIVDFVFKLLLMQHLGLQDYPVFMDEVGGSFDPIHRDKLYQYIKLLVETNQIQQVFIISHIASSHNALSTADKCVLDLDATMIDEEVNKVLTFS